MNLSLQKAHISRDFSLLSLDTRSTKKADLGGRKPQWEPWWYATKRLLYRNL